MSSNAFDNHSPSPELIPHNTLMGLPDELITKIITYAVTSDSEAINLHRETLEQDLKRMRAQLLAPFFQTPSLRVIAEAEYRPSELLYRTLMPMSQLLPLHIADLLAAPIEAQIEIDPEAAQLRRHEARELWFHCPISRKLNESFDHITHLELVVPLEPGRKYPLLSTTADDLRARANFEPMLRALPTLRTLVVRVTTYSYGSKTMPYPDVPIQLLYGASIPSPITQTRAELFAAEMQYHIAIMIRVLDGIHHDKLNAKTIVLCQKKQRDYWAWRDGPLGEPAFEINRSDHGHSGIDELVWCMMDQPSCRVTF